MNAQRTEKNLIASLDVKEASLSGKAFALVLLPILLSACSLSAKSSPLPDGTVRILLDQSPATLNPRATLDAAGQRINALLFRSLTRIDSDLVPRPDLAESWEAGEQGKVWSFKLREGLKDHEGEPITPEAMAACLENYRAGKPVSPLRGAFPSWETTEVSGRAITFRLSKPDPYLARNVTLLRYFRQAGSAPCQDPQGDRPVVSSGPYRPAKWDLSPEGKFALLPMETGRSPLELHFVHEDSTKSLKLLRGEVDAIQNAISLTKTRWIQREYAGRFDVLERDGVAVSYLAFNLKDPVLSRIEVRKAIALAIDRESIVRHKLLGFATLAGSFLSPLLPESHQVSFAHDPARAEKLLDAAGFPRGKDGVRLKLKYKSTPAREGIEAALLFQSMLRKVGVELVIDVVEPAVFFASVRKGAYQLHASRWLGVADGSILYNTLHTGQNQNRAFYSNPEMDKLLEKAVSEPTLEKRLPLLKEVQLKMGEELPYFPLWYWNTALIVRKGVTGLKPQDLSLSGAFEPLSRLRSALTENSNETPPLPQDSRPR